MVKQGLEVPNRQNLNEGINMCLMRSGYTRVSAEDIHKQSDKCTTKFFIIAVCKSERLATP